MEDKQRAFYLKEFKNRQNQKLVSMGGLVGIILGFAFDAMFLNSGDYNFYDDVLNTKELLSAASLIFGGSFSISDYFSFKEVKTNILELKEERNQ